MIDNAEIHKFVAEKIASYQKALDCDHTWVETQRYPSAFEPTCSIRYKCSKCGFSTGESIPWTFEDHLTWCESKKVTV